MICTSISEKGLDDVMAVLTSCEMAEIRIDLCELSKSDVATVFQSHKNLIATCRPDVMGEDKATALLQKAIESGARYVDIEVEKDEKKANRLIARAEKLNCEVIVSYHNYEETPSLQDLITIIEDVKGSADIVKIACMAPDQESCTRLLSLYNADARIIAFGMGKEASFTRVVSLLLGAEFAFAARTNEQATAPGQLTTTEMTDLLDRLTK